MGHNRAIPRAAVAQWIEYWPPKPRVVGSIPASRAKNQQLTTRNASETEAADHQWVVIGWSSGGQSADRSPDGFIVPDTWPHVAALLADGA